MGRRVGYLQRFGEIPHSGLMSAIEERIADRHVLKLLRAMLRAGVMQDGTITRDVIGTPQGGVLSPCLCNVYLHRLDRQWTERGHGVLVRFADDLLAMCRTRAKAEAALAAMRRSSANSGSSSRTPRPGSCTWSWTARGRVEPGRGAGVAAGPFPRPARRTGRAHS